MGDTNIIMKLPVQYKFTTFTSPLLNTPTL